MKALLMRLWRALRGTPAPRPPVRETLMAGLLHHDAETDERRRREEWDRHLKRLAAQAQARRRRGGR